MQSLSPITRVAALSLAVSFFGMTGQAAATVVQDFDNAGTAFVGQKLPSPAFVRFPQNAGPAPTVTAGGPTGNFLRLKAFETRSATNAGFDRDGAGLFNRIAGSFDFRITCTGARTGFSGGGCADGFNVGFLDTALFGNSGQADHVTDGLVLLNEGSEVQDYSDDAFVAVDQIRSGFLMGFAVFSTAGAVHIGDGATRLASQSAGIDLATGTNSTPDNTADGFINASFSLNFDTDLFSLTLTRGATTVDVFSNFDISGLNLDPFNARLALGTRSGDAAAAFDIDNINIRFLTAPTNDAPEPATLTLLGLGLAGLGLARRRRR